MTRTIRDKKLDRLSRIPLFRGCTSDQLLEVGRLVDEVDRPAGTVLAVAGRRAAEVFLVTRGAVDAYGPDGHRISSRERLVGQSSVETNEPNEHSVVAETDVTLLVTDVRSYRALVDVVPALHADRAVDAAAAPPPHVKAPAYA